MVNGRQLITCTCVFMYRARGRSVIMSPVLLSIVQINNSGKLWRIGKKKNANPPILFQFLGVGKTTLLRSIANHELHLPSHVTVLHVEQEVVGDDTVAVESVLECDVERTALLKREHELLAQSAE